MKTTWTENYTLHVKRESDGEAKVLFDGNEFKNFDWLAQQVGGSNSMKYINLNDDLMDGVEANGETFQHTIYKDGEAIDTLTFEYRRKA